MLTVNLLRPAILYTISTTACVPFNGFRDKDGYGLMYSKTRKCSMRAHRFVWEQANGSIPKGMFVCHKCDNPACINIEHLFLGDPTTNNEDKIRKKRQAHGEKHFRARFSEKNIEYIRRQVAAGVSQTAVAEELNCRQTDVSRIVNGATWAHLPVLPLPPEARIKNKRHTTKITMDQVAMIRQRFEHGEWSSYASASRDLRLSAENVRAIVLRKIWKDVP